MGVAQDCIIGDSLRGIVQSLMKGHHQERADERLVSDGEVPLLLQSADKDQQNLSERRDMLEYQLRHPGSHE